jgi:hypothetical protein
MTRLNKQIKGVIIFLFFFGLVFYIVPMILMKYNSVITTADYKKISVIRSTDYVVYSYEVNGRKYEGSFNKDHIHRSKFKEFKDGKGMKIRYSKWLPFYSELYKDEREVQINPW